MRHWFRCRSIVEPHHHARCVGIYGSLCLRVLIGLVIVTFRALNDSSVSGPTALQGRFIVR